ncbi:hypothetical protein C0J52_20231 [Blattella germanica]|nr:hypothetical protein C0J52_20231 [Blattella germanica]
MSIKTATGTSSFSSSSSAFSSEEEAAPVEEVAPQEVEETGPLYTDEELDALTGADLFELVRRVKDFTTLFDLHEEDWTADVEAVIKSYFTDKKEERNLCVYFENLTLSAAFEFPSTAVTDLT